MEVIRKMPKCQGNTKRSLENHNQRQCQKFACMEDSEMEDGVGMKLYSYSTSLITMKILSLKCLGLGNLHVVQAL